MSVSKQRFWKTQEDCVKCLSLKFVDNDSKDLDFSLANCFLQKRKKYVYQME